MKQRHCLEHWQPESFDYQQTRSLIQLVRSQKKEKGFVRDFFILWGTLLNDNKIAINRTTKTICRMIKNKDRRKFLLML
jgi:hypothetical protein